MSVRRRMVEIGGVDDYTQESREILELIVEGDLAGYDVTFAGSPEWYDFWMTHGETVMRKMLEIVRRYEEVRPR